MDEDYWRGFNTLLAMDAERYLQLVTEGEIKANGKEPTTKMYLELVELGKQPRDS